MRSDGTYYLWLRTDVPEKVGPHFLSSEFACRCSRRNCGEQRISRSLISKLERVRAAAGPLVVTSGYRCPAHQADLLTNPAIETVPKSQHVLGHAADIRLATLNATSVEFQALMLAAHAEFTAIGEGIHFLHVDERPGNHLWFYPY